MRTMSPTVLQVTPSPRGRAVIFGSRHSHSGGEVGLLSCGFLKAAGESVVAFQASPPGRSWAERGRATAREVPKLLATVDVMLNLGHF